MPGSDVIGLPMLFVCALGIGCSSAPALPQVQSVAEEVPRRSTDQSNPTAARKAPFDPDEWEAADRATVRLEPKDFPDLPPSVRQDLEHRGCTIPQTTVRQEPHNVISGHFTQPDQVDWAVLCSRDRVSSILVFRKTENQEVVELASADDRGFLQGSGGGSSDRRSIYFSRMIEVADPTFIRDMNEAYGHIKLPPLDHDGINDAFVEKASTVRYWYGGKWLQLAGAD